MREVLELIEEDIVVVDEKGKIKFCNTNLCKHLGYSQIELIGSFLEVLIGNEELAKCLIEEKSGVIPRYVLDLRTKEMKLKSYELEVISGQWEGEPAYFIKGLEVDEEEYYTKEDLELILDQLPVMIGAKSADGKYFYVNRKAEKYFEQNRQEMIGKSDCEVFGAERGSYFDYTDDKIMIEKKERQVESWVKTPTGKVKVLKLEKSPIYNEQREVMGVLKVGREQTLSRLLELSQEKKYQQILKVTSGQIEWEELLVGSSRIEISESAIQGELQGIGCAIWVYNSLEREIECKFMSKVNQSIATRYGEETVYQKKIPYNFEMHGKSGIYAIGEVTLKVKHAKVLLEKFKEKGIKYVGIYQISLNGEFLGFMNVLYETYDSLDVGKIEDAKKICNGIAYSIKQDKLAMEIKEELKKRNIIEQELQHFLDTATDILFIIDEDGKIIKGTEDVYKLCGKSKVCLMESDLLEVVYPEDRVNIEKIKEICKQKGGETKRINIKFVQIDNQYLWGECGVKYLPDKREFIWSIRDITEVKQLEEEKEQYQRKLYMENLRSEFLSNISHELKTPLNIILSTIQLLSGEERTDLYMRYLEYIRRNSYRLLRLINNLIDMTRIEAGNYQLNFGVYNIVEVVEEITLSAARYVQEKGIEIIFDTECEEEEILCDSDRIERVMLNLISNAIKYNSNPINIKVNIALKKEIVIVSVIDNGEGIPKNKLESIFDGFMQVDRSLTRLREGSGIGLSLAKALIEIHNGKIYAQSELGKGTKVSFELHRGINGKSGNRIDYKRLKTGDIEKCHIEFADIYEVS